MNNCIYRKYHAFCHPGSEKRQIRIFSGNQFREMKKALETVKIFMLEVKLPGLADGLL